MGQSTVVTIPPSRAVFAIYSDLLTENRGIFDNLLYLLKVPSSVFCNSD